MPDRRAVVTARPSAPRATLDDAVDYPLYLDVRLRRTPGKAVMTGRDVTRQWLRRHHADGPRRLPLPELVPSTFRVIEPGQRRARMSLATRSGADGTRHLTIAWQPDGQDAQATRVSVR